jgi:hypothetical protein
MKKLIKTSTVSALAVWLPWVSWVTIKTYLLTDPDSKFGAKGGVIFVVAMWGLAAVVSGISAVLVNTLATNFIKTKNKTRTTIIAISCGLVLSLLATLIPRLPVLFNGIYGDIAGMVLSWFIISCIVFIVGHLIDYWRQPDNAFNPDAE